MDCQKGSLKIFILCAGYGTRLRPITDRIPKPLIPLLGRPLLDHILNGLKSLKPEAIGINIHHLPDRMLPYCESKGNFVIFLEKEILGTGGALKNAEKFLSGSTFLVHNGDVLAEVDYESALRFHKEKGALATLLVYQIPWANNLLIDKEGRLITVLSAKDSLSVRDVSARVGFTGIAFYEQEFLRYLRREYSSVVDGWLRAIRAGERILTYLISGPWFDLGTPERYMKALFYLLKKEGENLFIHPQAEVEDLQIKGYVSIETETRIEKGTSLTNVVVIAERKSIGGSYRNGILFENQFIQIAESEIPFMEERGFPVGFGGSERRFYRISNSTILMIDPQVEDLERTIKINKLLRKRGINLPEILEVREGEIRFRDLGDLSLYNYIKIQKNKENIKKIFAKVLEETLKLHLLPIDSEIMETFPLFNRNYFRWETEYFEDKFLNYLCGLRADRDLVEEFERLAEISSNFPNNIIHRDLQSQNILIYEGEVYFVDYQGARIGPPGYDIASLIFDPYWNQDEEFRRWAIDFYIERRVQSDPAFESALFLKSLPYLRLQRHLQALSAYVNLSFLKGKRHFFRFFPRCLKYLIMDVEALREEFPVLKSYLRTSIGILKKRGILSSEEALSI